MLIKNKLAVFVGVVTAALVAPLQHIYAQQEEEDGYRWEEILVSARKKEEVLLEVPIAVTAIGESLIESASVFGLEDVARLTPGFSFERTTGSLAQPSIRGLVQQRVTNPVQNVATYFNGIYLQRSYQVDVDLLGIDRVEVYKGPQSAQFGRNAFGGAVNYITSTPSFEEIVAMAEVGFGSDALQTLRGALSMPFGQRFAMSVAVASSEFDGTWENENVIGNALDNPEGALFTEGNLGGHEKTSYLIQLRAEPTDALSVSSFYNAREVFYESPATYQLSSLAAVRADNTGNCFPFERGPDGGLPNQLINGDFGAFCGEMPAPSEILADRRSFGQDTTSVVAGINIDYQLFKNFTLSYDFGLTDAENTTMSTLSADPINGTFLGGLTLLDSRGNGTIETSSHDFRFDYDAERFRAMVGVFISTVEDFDFGASYAVAPNSNTPLTDIPFNEGGNLLGSVVSTLREEDITAFYGLVSYGITEKLNVTLEGRQTIEDVTQQDVSIGNVGTDSPSLNREFSYFTPRISMDYAMAEQLRVYASFAQGTKSGGFNPAANLVEEQVYDPEENSTAELGLKGVFFDNKLNLDLALFSVSVSDLQGSRGQTGAQQGDVLILDNFSSATSNGFEAAALFLPSDHWSFNLGISLADATFDAGATDSRITRGLCQPRDRLSADAPPCPYSDDVGGNDIQQTPKLKFNTGAAFEYPIGSFLGSQLNVFARSDFYYQDEMFADPQNTAIVSERYLLDGSIGIRNDSWKIRLWAKNIADEEYVSYPFATLGAFEGGGNTYTAVLGDRRSFGLTVNYQYFSL